MGEAPLDKLTRQELQQRLAHALAVGDEQTVAHVDAGMSGALLAEGDDDGARRHAERAVALCREHRFPDALLARALEALGNAAKSVGDGEAATGAYLEAIDLQSRHGEKAAVAALLGSLGGLAARAGDRDRARDLLASALRGTADSAADDGRRRAELDLAQIELEDGDDTSAARRALRVLQGGASGALALQSARLLQHAGEVAARRGDHEVARRRYEFALPVVRREGTGDAVVGLLRLLGGACRRSGEPAAARGYWEEAVTLCSDADTPGAELLDTRGALLHELGDMSLTDEADPAGALGYLEEALTVSDAAGSLGRVVLTASALHQAATRLGDTSAMERWRGVQSRATFAVAVSREALRLLGSGEGDEPPTYVLGDTGGAPHVVRIPGGRVSDGVIWRRRLATELRRAAPRGRVAVLRRVRRQKNGGAVVSVQMLIVDAGGVEARQGGCGPSPERWRRVVQPKPGADRLVEALRAALR
ncbi:MAG TPA: tetratricopeptide repeat protein [Candidatus Angelobacter sp.]|jgi:tetratricopeptide (TPR) repeat protein|nr:tetratricopeptide repeat protein [Candidatus Angelobacter sp.]